MRKVIYRSGQQMILEDEGEPASWIDEDLYAEAEGVLRELLGGDYVSGYRVAGTGMGDGGDYIEVRLNEEALRRLCDPLLRLAHEGGREERSSPSSDEQGPCDPSP